MEGGKIDHKERIALIRAIEEGIRKEKELAIKQQQEVVFILFYLKKVYIQKEKEAAAKAELKAEKAKNEEVANDMKVWTFDL